MWPPRSQARGSGKGADLRHPHSFCSGLCEAFARLGDGGVVSSTYRWYFSSDTPLSVIPPIWFGKREEGERSMVYPWAAARVLQLLAYVHTYASYAAVG